MTSTDPNELPIKRVKNLTLASRELAQGLLAGNYRSVFKGPGLEIDEVRAYSPGEDARSIDWNVSARMNEPFSKTFREERELVLFLLIDVSSSLFSGTGPITKRQAQGIVASLLAYAAVQNNDQVGAVFFTDRIEKWVPPMKGQKQVNRLVHDLMHIKPKGKGSDLALALGSVYESLKRRGICILLSDFRTMSGWKELTLLRRKHDVVAIRIADPSDREFPVKGMVEMVDPETGKTAYGWGWSRRYRKKYSDFWETQALFWKRECRRRGVGTLTISTEDDPVKKLLLYFNRSRSRR